MFVLIKYILDREKNENVKAHFRFTVGALLIVSLALEYPPFLYKYKKDNAPTVVVQSAPHPYQQGAGPMNPELFRFFVEQAAAGGLVIPAQCVPTTSYVIELTRLNMSDENAVGPPCSIATDPIIKNTGEENA